MELCTGAAQYSKRILLPTVESSFREKKKEFVEVKFTTEISIHCDVFCVPVFQGGKFHSKYDFNTFMDIYIGYSWITK